MSRFAKCRYVVPIVGVFFSLLFVLGAVRAEEHARQQVPEDGTLAQPLGKRAEQKGPGEQEEEIGECAPGVQGT